MGTILAIIGLIFVGYCFVDEIKTYKWRGVVLCVVVVAASLIEVFKKELGLEGLRLYLVIAVTLIVPLVLLDTGIRSTKIKKK